MAGNYTPTGSTASSGITYPAENVSSGSPLMLMNSYVDWLNDESNEPYRILLIELDNAEDTVRIGSQAWLSDENLAYDNWLVGEPYIEYDLSNSIDVGDIDAINPDLSVNWLDHTWRGHRARWYFGDTRWRKSEFRLIATSAIDRVRQVEDRIYRFDLVSDDDRLRQTFYEEEESTVESRTVGNAIDWALSHNEFGISREYINLGPDDLAMPLTFEVTTSTTIDELLTTIADSVGASTRITQSGSLEIIKPDTVNAPAITLNADNVATNGIRMVDTIHPVRNIRVIHSLGEELTIPTGAQTGSLNEATEFLTYLSTEADAEAFGLRKAVAYVVAQNVWEIVVVGLSAVIHVGDHIDINHPVLVGAGVVDRVRREPLSNISRIEVTI